jgi:predicted transcriptional regulator of viral defense system
MQISTQELINFFKSNNGIARLSAIRNAGFHPDSLFILEKNHKVEKIARGLYRLIDYAPKSYSDLISASLQAPRGVVCLMSALSFHEATVEVPKYIDIAVQKGTRAYRIKYPPVKFYHISLESWEVGIEEQKIEYHTVKIYNLAKTIADCCKFRNKIGMNIVREALKIAVSEKNIKPKEIMHYSKICRVDKIIKPMLEIIL